ncbi:Glycosyltransferase subfamily 4-like, N-terminal domain [Dillenia turbinata]|uniref:Glycosyltransferase subfamily 4-like, N-terminal domain n=1 Tax=Dillenia turbinata TaxID=194707 RepID=A0AAN8VU25_9MAGN
MTSVPGHRLRSTTPIRIMALDGIINVNSVFTLALFLGLSLNPTDPTSTLTTACSAVTTSVVAEHRISSHVFSFSSFLFSSLITFALKQSIKIFGSSNVVFSGRDEEVRSVTLTQVNRSVLKTGILVSAIGSASGSVFLVLAMIDLVHLKLGACAVLLWYWFLLRFLSIFLLFFMPSLVRFNGEGFSRHLQFPQFMLHFFFLSAFSSISFLIWSESPVSCNSHDQSIILRQNQPVDLLFFFSPFAWNHLSFSSNPPPKLLKIAAFVKKWPHRNHAGGLERHALTLHLALAKRGHELHIFTTSPLNSSFPRYPFCNLYFHLSKPMAAGYLDQAFVWKLFQVQNSSGKPFDVIHTESVGLLHTRARNLTKLAVSWHGIAYEAIHSDIFQEVLWTPEDPQASMLTERLLKVVEEVKFFPWYTHHIATSDHAGDVLKRIYMIPEERVHVIINGVDEEIYKPKFAEGKEFKKKLGVQEFRKLVLGVAGRLVKDKGHLLMFEALKQLFIEKEIFRSGVLVLVAGDGPWSARYKDLGPNVLVLGPLEQSSTC